MRVRGLQCCCCVTEVIRGSLELSHGHWALLGDVSAPLLLEIHLVLGVAWRVEAANWTASHPTPHITPAHQPTRTPAPAAPLAVELRRYQSGALRSKQLISPSALRVLKVKDGGAGAGAGAAVAAVPAAARLQQREGGGGSPGSGLVPRIGMHFRCCSHLGPCPNDYR